MPKKLADLKVDAAAQPEQAELPGIEEDTDFPEGTILQLNTKKYLWGVMGHVGLHVPVTGWDEVDKLVDAWFDYQKDLEDALSEDLAELYSGQNRKRSSTSKTGARREADGDDARRKLLGIVYKLGTEKGVYVNKTYPNINAYDETDLKDLIAELDEMEPQGTSRQDEADTTSRSRVSRARRAR